MRAIAAGASPLHLISAAEPTLDPMRSRDRSSLRRPVVHPVGSAFWVLLPVALALFVYRKLVNVYFNSDDFLNLYFIVNRAPLDYFLRPHGGHLLILRNAIFYASFQLFGAYPEYYFATVLLTHALNVALLFLLVWRMTNNAIVSAVVSALWGISPVHTGTLGWYSVYGQVVVATILLTLLNQAVRPVSDGTALPRRTVLVWPLLLLAASFCFGIGIGITLVAPLVLFLLAPRSSQRLWACAVLVVLALSMPKLYAAAVSLHEWYAGPTAEAFAASVAMQQSSFSLHQIMMVAYLMSCGLGGMVVGFLGVVNAFPPGAWIIAAAFVAATIITFIGSDARIRAALVAFTVLLAGSYGIIAIGRAQFFQADTLAAGAAQARYHYVATLPFAAMLGLILARFAAWLRLRAIAHTVLLVAWLAVAGVSYHRAVPFIDLFPTAREETLIVINTVLKKVGQAWKVREVFLRNYPFRAIGPLYIMNQPAFPGWAAIYTIFFPSNTAAGRQVYFVDNNPAVTAAAQRGRRTQGLIISPDDLRPCEYP